jgi:hypothetical protein
MISDVEIRVVNLQSLANQLSSILWLFWDSTHRRPSKAYLVLHPNGSLRITTSLSFIRQRHACILTEFRASPKQHKNRVLYIVRDSLARDFEDEIRDILLSTGVILKIEGE